MRQFAAASPGKLHRVGKFKASAMMIRWARRTWVAMALLLALTVTSAAVAAQLPGPNPENLRNRKIIKTAYYEPKDTYFQLASDVVDKTGTGKWAYALEKARRAEYEGRQGRLAKVDSAELHQWVIETFEFSDLLANWGVWIGLRYWCGVRMLTWSTGEEHKPSDFSAWDTPWYGGKIRCGRNEIPYMGVFYTQNTNRWKAMGYMKRFRYYLIEFPPESDNDDTNELGSQQSNKN